jgi:arylsulfatase A-like enzyme
MKHPSIPRFIAPLLMLCWFASTLANPLAAPPNIVILLADDAGFGDFGFTGNQTVQTPNIDRIAAEGLRMNRFYVCPVCSPTRAELLTGRYYPRCGVQGVSLGQERLNLDETTLANHLQNAGYKTGAFGKWHNGSQWPFHPNARGFNTFFGYTAGHWGEYFNPELELNGVLNRESGYIVDICTDKALEFIEQNRGSPFLCYVPFTTPHSPWSVPQTDWDRWKNRPLRQTATAAKAESPEETRCALAMIENQDANVGRILNKLDQLKLTPNTIVIFFSDNGPNTHRWNNGFKGKKGDVDEGGVRSPFAVRWPDRIAPGRSIDDLTGVVDLMPTLLAAVGIKFQSDASKPLDGKNIAPRWTDPAARPTARQLISHWGNKTAIREDNLLLDANGALFDLASDPAQTHDLSSAEKATADRLASAVQAWRKECGMDARPTRGAGATIDARPFTIGFRKFPITILPARDGTPANGLKRSSTAPNSSYFTDWKSTDCEAVWNVDVHEAGTYQVAIDLTCPASAVPLKLVFELNGASLTNTLTEPWDPPLNTNQDTLNRPKAESQLKPFRTWKMGSVRLPKGTGLLKIRVSELNGASAIDLRRITLTLD